MTRIAGKFKYGMKPFFEERMRKLLPNERDFAAFEKIIHQRNSRWIRCNTLKIGCDELFERLGKKWKVVRPFSGSPEIFLVEGKRLSVEDGKIENGKIENGKIGDKRAEDRKVRDGKVEGEKLKGARVGESSELVIGELEPGELGNSIEHLLGYFYVQEVSSMMPPLALDPKPDDFVLDLTAAPGSKTTQIAAKMENEGTIIANDNDFNRIKILAANLERCGVTNTIVTRQDGVLLCEKLAKAGFMFDKILLDLPCSGEGTLRSSPKTFKMWNIKVVKKLSRQQKKLFASALKCLKVGGTVVYSTCTHSPEENEEIVDFALRNFPVEVEKFKLPLKCRKGVIAWNGKKFNKDVEKVCRIYPQDNDSEGFFVSRFKLVKDLGGLKDR